jgi:hypothetical protein
MGGADEDEGHAAANRRAQAVRPGAHRRLDQQRGDVIQRHKEADPDRRQVKAVGQEQRHEGVIGAPDYANAKKTKTQQERFAVIQLHGSPLSLS